MNTDWVNEDTMIGYHYHCGENVMSFHIGMIDGIRLYAVARWWYGNPYVLAIFNDREMIHEGE